MKKELFSLVAILSIGTSVLKSQPTDSTNRRDIRIEKRQNSGKPDKTIIIIDNGKITVNGEEVKDLNGKLDMLGKGNFNFDDMQYGPEMRDMFKNFSPKMQGIQNFKERFFNLQNARSNNAMLGVNVKDDNGARITEVVKESGAEKAGLKTDDIITSINSDKITDGDVLIQTIGKYKPEDVVDVTVLRNGKEKKFKATLGKNETALNNTFNWNNNGVMPPPPPLPPDVPGAFNFNRDGFRGFNQDTDRPKFGFDIKDNEDGDGVIITEVKDESNASKAGLKEADIITAAAGTPVKTVDDLKRILAENRDKSAINITVLRSGKSLTFELKVPKKIKTAEL